MNIERMSGAARNFHKLDLAPSNWCCCMCSHLQGAKVIGFFQLVVSFLNASGRGKSSFPQLGFGLILLTILAVSNDNQPTAGQPGAVLIRGLILGFGVLLVFVSSFLLVGLFKVSFPPCLNVFLPPRRRCMHVNHHKQLKNASACN